MRASAEAMDEVIERGLVAAAAAYVRQAGGRVHEDPSLTWLSTGTRIPYYNGVVRTRLSAADAGAAIEAVSRMFHEQDWLMSWWVMPQSRPADLAARLTSRGFALWGGDLGMAVDLGGVPAAVPLPSGVTVERVETTEGMFDWLRAFGRGFGIDEARLAIYSSLPLGVPPSQSRFRFFLARAAGLPTATSLWFPADDAAVLDEIATVPEQRRRGMATAVTHAALADARVAGYRTAVLVASEAGVPVYRRLGFESYGRRTIYLQVAPEVR
jgi:ribosomal protein S18 acetylase RimI-like enzyme